MSDQCCGSSHHLEEQVAPAAPGRVDSCCSGDVPLFDGIDPRYKRVLWIVIGINGLMFLAEMFAGQVAGSQALQADALDFLADTVTYGLSLAVIGASLKTRAIAALFKGMSLSAMSLWVFGSTVYQTLVLGLPRAELMGAIGFLALTANISSVLLLMRYKDGDANVRSVWLCSRNDAIGNVVVIGTAVAVWGTANPWPDLAVAGFMASIFLMSSAQILRQAWAEYSRNLSQRAPQRRGRPTAAKGDCT